MADRRKPMLASASTGAAGSRVTTVDALLNTGGWALDAKIDGIRAWARGGRLLNRLGVDITHRYPEITVPEGEWFDGEIVAHDGSFESTLLRDQQELRPSIAILAASTPCRFVAFDLPEYAHEPWVERRRMLQELDLQHPDLVITPMSADRTLFDSTLALGMEGVIAKRIGSRYQFGRRSPDWVKFKHTRRVTCLAAGYEPGVNSRSHFGAMHLVMVDAHGDLQRVGRVGSGFTDRETHQLKARLDAAEVLVVEIECLNRTKTDQLRFPVYKGIRTDVAPTACTTDQLDALPRC